MTGPHATIACLLVLLAGGAIATCNEPTRAQDGHAQMHHEYLKWKDGRGYGCCNELDCRPTRAFMGDDGRWRALVDGLPIVVPPDAVLNIPSPDGRSHICMSPGAIEPRCFVPAEPRS